MSTPNEKADRIKAIIAAANELVADAIKERIEAIEDFAAEQAEDKDTGKPPVAKLSLTFKWPAGEYRPKLTMKASHGGTRTGEYEAEAGKEQTKLEGVE